MKTPLVCSALILGAALSAQAQTDAPGETTEPAVQGALSPALKASMASDPFVKLDKDRDGYVSKDEADARMRKAWSKFDANGDGKVDSAEFAAGAD